MSKTNKHKLTSIKNLKMNNMPQLAYEDELCNIVATGHDWDFLFYIENKTDKNIIVKFNNDSEKDIYEEECTYRIKANNWIGFFMSDNGINLLENSILGKLETEKEEES